jgi:hypothetical protein
MPSLSPTAFQTPAHRCFTLGASICLLATILWLGATGPVAAQEAQTWALLGETHLETLPGLQADTPPVNPVEPAAERTAHPWWAAGLTLMAPGLLATPAAWGLWPAAVAAPAALAAGHLYAGDPQRAAWVGVGGASASVLGALSGAGVGQSLGLSSAAGAWAGGGLVFGGFASWAAWDAYQLAARRTAGSTGKEPEGTEALLSTR